MEKLAASIAGGLAIALGIWSRLTFVRRSEIYNRDGRPVYQHADNCKQLQQACNLMICKKIDEVKVAQIEAEHKRDNASAGLQDQLATIQQFMGRVEQYMRDHR